jgi:hypothetical protein
MASPAEAAAESESTWAVFVRSPGFPWRFWYMTPHEELASELDGLDEDSDVSIMRVEDGIAEP